MEQPNSIFSLSIDAATKSHLSEAAKWAKFLAIAGMVSLALLIVFGFYISTVMTSNLDRQFEDVRGGNTLAEGVGVGMAIVYLVIAIIWFFPLMYLLKFSNQMQHAIAGNNQETLNSSFQNLKICFRYLGIVTIIGIAFYLITFLITITTANNL
jgi:hypothetical protein